jgi:hypothetical protein
MEVILLDRPEPEIGENAFHGALSPGAIAHSAASGSWRHDG